MLNYVARRSSLPLLGTLLTAALGCLPLTVAGCSSGSSANPVAHGGAGGATSAGGAPGSAGMAVGAAGSAVGGSGAAAGASPNGAAGAAVGGSTGVAGSPAGSAGSSAAGAAGASNTGGAGSGNGGAGANCGGLALCDTFEDTAVGSPPKSSLWTLVPSSASGSATVDSMGAHGSSHSLKVVSPDRLYLRNTSVIGTLGAVIHVRFHLRLGSALADGHGAMIVTHPMMVDQYNQSNELRFGSQANVFHWNTDSDSANIPDVSPNGNAASVNPQPTPGIASSSPSTATAT